MMPAAFISPPDLLEAIVAATRRRVASARKRTPLAAIDARAARLAPRGDAFRAALVREGTMNVIAECKRRSPSRGVLRAAYDPAAVAAAYEAAGAAAISVLTEPTFFDGALDHLRAVRSVVRLPVLRKDFIVDDYQLAEARAAGADAILLIVAVLSDAELRGLQRGAGALGLATVVEVHGVDELDRALDAGAVIVGVNNRNLRTLRVDTGVSEAIAIRIPDGVVAVSESGLRTRDELVCMRELGYEAFLIGERFMTATDPGLALRELLNLPNASERC